MDPSHHHASHHHPSHHHPSHNHALHHHALHHHASHHHASHYHASHHHASQARPTPITCHGSSHGSLPRERAPSDASSSSSRQATTASGCGATRPLDPRLPLLSFTAPLISQLLSFTAPLIHSSSHSQLLPFTALSDSPSLIHSQLRLSARRRPASPPCSSRAPPRLIRRCDTADARFQDCVTCTGACRVAFACLNMHGLASAQYDACIAARLAR